MYWTMRVENAHDYSRQELIPKIKAIIGIMREAGMGGLKEANDFLRNGGVLKAHSQRQVHKILKVCDAEGLMLDIRITRRLTPTEYDEISKG